MSSASLIASSALVLVVTAFIARWIRSWCRLRHIPGPPIASLSAAWMLQKLCTGDFNEALIQVAETHGPLARIGPNDLLCTDPDTLRRVAGARSVYIKGDFYETGRVVPGYNNIVSERDETKHKALRAAMAGGYLGRETGSLAGIEACLDRQLRAFIALIETKYISEPGTIRPLDFAIKSQFFALDVISELSFGRAFGFLVEDRDLYDYVKINESAIPVMNTIQAIPWITNALYSWPLRLGLPSTGDKVGLGRLMGLAKHYVDERFGPGAKVGQDMLQAFINGGMSHEDLIQHMFVQIVAGSITIAAAIRHTFLALISTPTAYSALQAEIDVNIASGKISSPTITEAEAHNLVYLQAVIHEGLRMWPPATGLGSKQVPPEGDFICGFRVPGGTQVATNFMGIMRLKSIWGEDANVFRPERWVEADDAQRQRMASVLDLAFGSGKYQCLGKRVAMMELDKVFVELLRRFDFALTDPVHPIKSFGGNFWVGSDMWLRVTCRSPTPVANRGALSGSETCSPTTLAGHPREEKDG
ncbi:cytochrome P450 monooxygenase lolP1 [Echria macrotheca]|uniref:Cytochrome P450 monooxygenase lolP1 n=1 Tax=Echria macrotheca TaxID=438768 RepID=A0AAJ0BHZ5_9PEZI|nr:cytochrome P450 monooxygenase lolP1 [Echria macrotheca]